MLIGNKYKLDTDPNNLILRIKSISKKSKKENWNIIGYFYDFRELLKFMADNEIKGIGLEDLKAVAKRQEELYDLILTLQKITPDQFHVKVKRGASTGSLRVPRGIEGVIA